MNAFQNIKSLSKIFYFSYLQYYAGPGVEEDYAIYVYKSQQFDGIFKETLRMTNLRSNETINLAAFDRFHKFDGRPVGYSKNMRQVIFS